MLYFDHNATCPLHEAARQAWLEAAEQFPANPSSPHRLGARADGALSRARERLAACLGCHADDVIWTSGATESNNMVFHALAAADSAREIWISSIEHPCVIESARHYFGAGLRTLPVTRDGVFDVDWLRHALRTESPALVAVMAANNETGVLQPWADALSLCREAGVPLLCDAAQWIGKLAAAGIGACDFVSGCAHKFGGPRGVGFLKCPSGGRLQPLLRGGEQEFGRRAGTENLAGVLSMIAILETRERQIAAGEHQHRERERLQFEGWLLREVPGTEILGRGAPRLWNTVSAIMPELPSRQRWVVRLDKAGCAVSTGSACSSGREKPSHVLEAMSCPERDIGRVLRFSSGWETTAADWETLRHGVLQVFKSASS